MPDASWSPTLPITVVLVLLCLVVTGVLGTILIWRLQEMRTQTERRFGELAQRLRLTESRIDRFENRGGPAAPASEKSPGCVAPKASLKDRWTHSLPEPRERNETQSHPTLIAIPDLAAVEHEHDPRAGNELGERHGEVWALAAAGVPPEEIARQTGQPIGQVELIMGLYRQLHHSGDPIDHARSH